MKTSEVHTGAPNSSSGHTHWSPGRQFVSPGGEPASGIQSHLVTAKYHGNVAGQLPELNSISANSSSFCLVACPSLGHRGYLGKLPVDLGVRGSLPWPLPEGILPPPLVL